MEIQQAFREETAELLAELEGSLLKLEKSPDSRPLIDRVFRAMHTIKGSGSMFGFDTIASFTHHIETAYDLVREGRISVDRHLINLTLEASDLIKLLIGENAETGSHDPDHLSRVISDFKRLATMDDVPLPHHEPPEGNGKTAVSSAGDSSTFRIRFHPQPNIFLSGIDPAMILEELRKLGDIIIVPQTEGIPALSELDPEKCYLFWDMILTTRKPANAIKDAFIFIENESEVMITKISNSTDNAADMKKRLGEILVERGDILPSQINDIAGRQKKIGELLVESGLVSPSKVTSALKEQERVSKTASGINTASIRVPADRLDNLINLVGELVITQARLSQVAGTTNNSELMSPIEIIERLTEDLRDCVLNIRMLPIGTTFNRFSRLVRDLSGELGKEINLITEGGKTELDKTVMERLGDPLVHMIRNSIDHGIEWPQEREAAGKPRHGTIRLTAKHLGGHVVITISDDGKGIDPEAVKAKAVEKGLLKAGMEIDEAEIAKFIFVPGFSTSRTVSSISGRGVGMDVVKRTIDDMRGTIAISSQKTKGTTFTVTLPLTLAIIEGLLVRVEQDRFVLPLALVEECVGLSETDISQAHGNHIIYVRNELLPYVRIRELFSISGHRPTFEQLAIVNVDGERIGIVVDEIIGDHQTVIKSLGKVYRNAEGISGATILGDGGIALIIDIPKLVQCAVHQDIQRQAQIC